MNLGDRRFTRNQIRQGGGRGSGNDHVDELYGSSELYVYRPVSYTHLRAHET